MLHSMLLAHLHLKPAPRRVHLAQVLLHKGQRRQAALARADQPHALGVYPEVVAAHLLQIERPSQSISEFT